MRQLRTPVESDQPPSFADLYIQYVHARAHTFDNTLESITDQTACNRPCSSVGESEGATISQDLLGFA